MYVGAEHSVTAGASAGHSSPRCLAVMYHYVHGEREREPYLAAGIAGLTDAEFDQQLDLLTKRLQPVDWPTLYGWMQGRCNIPDRSFLLTFDDGLAEHARVVAPMLERRGLRGVFFVSGAALTAERLLPAHAIHLLLCALGAQRLEEELCRYLAEYVQHKDWRAEVNEEQARAVYHYETPQRARLKYLLTMILPPKVRNAALDALFVRHLGPPAHWARRWYMNWEELAALQKRGHTIGAHGYSHEPLARLTPQERRAEFAETGRLLSEKLGAQPRPVSYPYGSFDDDVVMACREAGFAQAFTTQRQWVTRDCDAFRLPRVDTIYVEETLQQEAATCAAA